MKLNCSFHEKNEMDLIHEKSLDVLKNVGIIFHSKEAIEILKANGVKIDGNRAFFQPAIVENALKTIPSQFEWQGRQSSLVIGDGMSKNIPSLGPIYVSENGKFHSPTPLDYANFHKLHETSRVIHAANPNILDPQNVDRNIREKYRMASTLMYSTKPLMGITDGYNDSMMSIQMIREFYDVWDKILLVGLISIAGPLHISPAMCEAMIAYAREGQAVVIAPGGSASLTAPPSLAGCALQSNAERLGGATFVQLVNPGTPVIFGCNQHATDIRYSSYGIGAPETALMTLTARVIGNYYNVPVRSGGCLTDSKVLDYEAGAESMLTILSSYMAGIDFILHSAGILDTFNSLGYEKFMLDEELIQTAQRYMRGYEVNEDTLLYEKIVKAGPGGDYISRTQKSYLNDYSLPKYQTRESHNNWISSGSVTVENMANKDYKNRLETYVLPELLVHQRKIIDDNIPKELLF